MKKSRFIGRRPGHARLLAIGCLVLIGITVLALTGCALNGSSSLPDAQGASGTSGSTPSSTSGSGYQIHAPAKGDSYQARLNYTINWYLTHMSFDEKLGQMFLIETYGQSYNADDDNMVRNLHAGALIIYGKNMSTPGQLKTYITAVQAHATIPLMVSMDEEGGVVDRLGYYHFAPPLPAAADLAATGSTSQAEQAGVTAAQEMQAFGINTDLAPVADVRTIPNAVEFTRLFGDDPATVANYAGAFLTGLQDNGEIGCLKHWPDIGSISLDPHKTLPTITHTLSQLETIDFASFRSLLALNPGMIMVTHVLVPAIDSTLPATLSPTLVNGVLRGELGYQGVVMTDSLYMAAIADHYNLAQAAVLSVEAGDDLLEGAYDSYSMSGMIAAIKAAIATGNITPARIDQSVARILRLKARFGLIHLMVPPNIHYPSQSAMLSSNLPTSLISTIGEQSRRLLAA